jgi:hypothetical protein
MPVSPGPRSTAIAAIAINDPSRGPVIRREWPTI